MEEGSPSKTRTPTEALPPTLRSLAEEVQHIVDSMADDNCLTAVLALADDLGSTQVFLLQNFSSDTKYELVKGCVDHFSLEHKTVALCLAVEAWLCDESRFRRFMNLDEQAAIEHLSSVGAEEQSAKAIASNLIQGVMLNMAQVFQTLYGDLSLFPASYEGVVFRMESINWGVHQRKAEIIRGVDEMQLEYDSGWRQVVAAGGKGTYTDLINTNL